MYSANTPYPPVADSTESASTFPNASPNLYRTSQQSRFSNSETKDLERSSISPQVEPPLVGERGKKKRKKKLLICCCCLLVLVILIVVGFLIFFFAYLSYPKVEFKRAIASPTRPSFMPTPNGFHVNLDLEFDVVNDNTFQIDVYSIDMIGFLKTPVGKSSKPDFNGTVTESQNFPKKATTRFLFPVTYQFRANGTDSKALLTVLLNSCASLSTQGRTPLNIDYEISIGIYVLKVFGYKFREQTSTSFACPFELTNQLNQFDI